MRKIVVTEFVTFDRVIEDPGGSEKTAHGGWSFRFWSDEAARYKYDELFAADALLLGRVTYEGFAAAWPTMEGTGKFGERMNALPKYVVSTTLDELTWNNSHLIGEDAANAIAKPKRQPGQDILVEGSGELIQTLMQHALVDEYRLMVHPIVLGGGKRLFREGSPTHALELVAAQPIALGVVVLTYRPARTEGAQASQVGFVPTNSVAARGAGTHSRAHSAESRFQPADVRQRGQRPRTG